MQTHSGNLELAVLDSLSAAAAASAASAGYESDSQKAWHLLSLLLSVGHPTPPHELASWCTLFDATPDLVKSLCSIPYSPITLLSHNSDDLWVTISPLGLLAFKRFESNFNLIDSFFALFGTGFHAPAVSFQNVLRTYFRKRKRLGFGYCDDDEKDRVVSTSVKRTRNVTSEVYFHTTEDIGRSINVSPRCKSMKLNDMILMPDLFIRNLSSKCGCNLKSIKEIEDETNTSAIVKSKEHKMIMEYVLHKEVTPRSRVLGYQSVFQEDKVEEIVPKSRTEIDAAFCTDDIKWSRILPVESASVNDASNDTNDCYVETTGLLCKQELLLGSAKMETEAESIFQPINTAVSNMPQESDSKRVNESTSLDKKEQITAHVRNPAILPKNSHFLSTKCLQKPSAQMKITCGDATDSRQKVLCQFSDQSKANKQHKRDQMKTYMNKKLKQKHNDMHDKSGKEDVVSVFTKDQAEPKDLPCFESYIVEAEEGSGGYGIVYKARRKNDGAIVAIKCPHANAHRQYISNELRMLERFGGKNFIIKYEGHFKHGNSECFVLEHVEHDRPEVLKREIDVCQLRWYAFCMFRALATLHKQGIVHRDVKPGNFLFSRKFNKGYLIDFNLAMDLHQKYGATNKLKSWNDVSFIHDPLANAKSAPPTKSKKLPSAKASAVANHEAAKGSKSVLESKNPKRKNVDQTRAHNDLGGWNVMKSQGADGSGITSARDVTSTRTPSAERLREPLPCQGRKELINLLQEAMQSPTQKASTVPASMRKRIAAPPRKVDGRLIYPTPMPLYSTGIAAAATGSIRNKGDGKHKKEGPCVGTQGFRAPEVLFRSLHQGPKVDIWSAGVTLLYLIMGRSPFYGDPEQNIKDIAKLRGSEDLWEVAKLHDRESAFPVGLFNTQCLPSMSLREWCQANSKRQDLLEVIPSSFIDLVDKCLIVNPRLRISAEDALKHEFFYPCNEALNKQRRLRRQHSLDSEVSLPLRGGSMTKPAKMSCLQA